MSDISSEGEAGPSRYGTWAPDEWDDEDVELQSESDVDDEGDQEMTGSSKAQRTLRNMPFETLVNAQKHLQSGDMSTDAQDESGRSHSRSANADSSMKRKSKAREVELAGRDSKNAPAVMSSKKQVTRNRLVVNGSRPNVRDPRLATSLQQPTRPLSQSSYSFLPDIIEQDLAKINDSLRAAIRAEKNCPLYEKPAKTAERERIERAKAQLSSKLQEIQRAERERAVISNAKKEERGKQKQGKAPWHMKKAERRDLLLKAKFDDLEASGGRRAVRKAIAKKQKKDSAKEKKKRPVSHR